MTTVIFGEYNQTYVNVCKQLSVIDEFIEFLCIGSSTEEWQDSQIIIDNVLVNLRFKNSECDLSTAMMNIFQSESVLFILSDDEQRNDKLLRNYFLCMKLANIDRLVILIDSQNEHVLEVQQKISNMMINIDYKPEMYVSMPIMTIGSKTELFNVLKNFEISLKNQRNSEPLIVVRSLSIENVRCTYRTRNPSENKQKIYFELNPDTYYLHETVFSMNDEMYEVEKQPKNTNNRIFHDFFDRNITWAKSIGAKICIVGDTDTELVSGMICKMYRLETTTDCRLEIVQKNSKVNGLIDVLLHFNEPIWFEKFSDCKQLGSFYLQEGTNEFFGIFEKIIEPYSNTYLERLVNVFYAIRQNDFNLLTIEINADFDFLQKDFWCFIRIAIYSGYWNIVSLLIERYNKLYKDEKLFENITKFIKELHDLSSLPINYSDLLKMIPMDLICDAFELKQYTKGFIEKCQSLCRIFELNDNERETLQNDIDNMEKNYKRFFGQNSKNVLRVKWFEIDYIEVFFEAILDPEQSNRLVKFNFDSIKKDGIQKSWILKKIVECDSLKCLDVILKMNFIPHLEKEILTKTDLSEKCPNIVKFFKNLSSQNCWAISKPKKLRGIFETDYIDDQIYDMLNVIKRTNSSEKVQLKVFNSISILLLCFPESSDCDLHEIMVEICKVNISDGFKKANLMNFLETIYYRNYHLSSAKNLSFFKKYDILKTMKITGNSKCSLSLWSLITTNNIFNLSLQYSLSDIIQYKDSDILDLFDNPYYGKPVLFFYKIFVHSIKLKLNTDNMFPFNLSSKIFTSYLNQTDIFCDFFVNCNYSAVLPF